MTEPILEGTALHKRFGKDDALRRTETRWTVPSTPSRSSSASGPRMAGRLSTASDAEKESCGSTCGGPDFVQRLSAAG